MNICRHCCSAVCSVCSVCSVQFCSKRNNDGHHVVTPSVANLQIPITSSQCNVALIAFYAFNPSNILSNTNTIVLHWLFSRKTEATWLYCDFWSCQAAQVWQWQGKATKWQGQYVLRASLTKQNNLRLSTVSLFGSLADLVWSQNITGNLRQIWRIPCHVWKSCSLLLRWHAAPNWEWLEQVLHHLHDPTTRPGKISEPGGFKHPGPDPTLSHFQKIRCSIKICGRNHS